MAIVKSRAYSFNLFGFKFLVWKKAARKTRGGGPPVMVNNSCKIIRHNNYIALAMPDGTLIPHQLDIKIRSRMGEVATAKVELFIQLDKPISET